MIRFKHAADLIAGRPLRNNSTWKLTGNERAHVNSLVALVEGAYGGNRALIDSFIKVRIGLSKDIAELNKWSPQHHLARIRKQAGSANRTIGNQVNDRLKDVRFVIWWVIEQRHFAPGLLCRDLASAVMAMLAARITAKQNFAVCALPSCRKRFIRTKKNNRYHSRKCGDTHRKQLSRARLRRKGGNGNVTDKTR